MRVSRPVATRSSLIALACALGFSSTVVMPSEAAATPGASGRPVAAQCLPHAAPAAPTVAAGARRSVPASHDLLAERATTLLTAPAVDTGLSPAPPATMSSGPSARAGLTPPADDAAPDEAAPDEDTGLPEADDVPPGLERGVLGVLGDATTGYTVVVDPSVVRLSDVRAQLVEGLDPASAAAVTVERSCRSVKSLAAAWLTLTAGDWHPKADTTSYSLEIDSATEKILVSVDPAGLDPSVLRALERVDPTVVEVQQGAVARTAGRLADPTTGGHRGGAGVGIAKNDYPTCSTGFTVIKKSDGKRASVTAAHCGDNGMPWWSGPYWYGKTAGMKDYPARDQARIEGSTYRSSIWTDGEDKVSNRRILNRQVVGARDPVIGSTVCASGKTSRSVCGITVERLDATICTAGDCTAGLIQGRKNGAVIVREGDSGAPVYQPRVGTARATIAGMVIASSNGGKTIYAERWSTISSHLGVRIATS